MWTSNVLPVRTRKECTITPLVPRILGLDSDQINVGFPFQVMPYGSVEELHHARIGRRDGNCCGLTELVHLEIAVLDDCSHLWLRQLPQMLGQEVAQGAGDDLEISCIYRGRGAGGKFYRLHQRGLGADERQAWLDPKWQGSLSPVKCSVNRVAPVRSYPPGSARRRSRNLRSARAYEFGPDSRVR